MEEENHLRRRVPSAQNSLFTVASPQTSTDKSTDLSLQVAVVG
jgi:hypothetical protein